MTTDPFLLWHERQQDRRYELLDGVPVAMADARRRHDRVVVNALVLFGGQLGVGPCRPFSSDTAARIPDYQVGYPDLRVDYGRFLDEDLAADAPRLVLEVLSATTRTVDFVRKVEEYKSVPNLRHIILVDMVERKVVHWSPQADGPWAYRTVEGLDATLDIPDLEVLLPLAALYKGLDFPAKPRLVGGDDPAAPEN
jgi:Uma2 family endonuclease